MKNSLLFLCFSSIILSCQLEPADVGIKGKEMGVEATVQIVDQNNESHVWQDDDMIGVSIDGMSDYHSDTNVAFSYDDQSGTFVPVKSGIILKGSERNLSAYYPFTGAENEIPEELEILTHEEYQTSAGMSGNDYLFARTVATREDPVARFDFQHVMSQMRLEFEEENGRTGEVSYTVSGLYHKGAFNPYTGEVRVTTTKSDDLTMTTSDMKSTLMLIPQNSEIAISLTFDGKTYAGVFTADLTSNECKVYKVIIGEETLDVSLTIIDSGSADWVVGEGGDITSEDNLDVMVSDAGVTKSYTDSEFRTWFEEGDQVGVFAVKDGAVMPNVNNRCLTFNGKEWTFDVKVNYNSTMHGAVFYAYYPYSEDASLDLSKSDPFSTMEKELKIPYDQSSEDVYRSCDLMTSSSEPYEDEGRYILDFGMVHRMALLSVTLPRRAYVFTNTDPVLDDYVLNVSSDVEFRASIGQEPQAIIRPYLDKDSQSHRFIVKPGDAIDVKCTFVKDGSPKKFSISLPSGIAKGSCEPFRVDGGYRKTVMELQVGDYYCADGGLVSYDPSSSVPDGVVGVIYRVGTPAAVSGAEPAFTHGLVYALAREKRPSVEGDPGKYSNFEEDDYVSVFGLAQDKSYPYGDIGLSTSDHNDTDLNGYGYTKSWLRYDGAAGANALFKASIESYRRSVILPEGMTTGWYLPSYDEYVLMAENADKLDASLIHASAETVFEGTAMGKAKYFRGYWTSSLRSTGAVVNYYSLGEEDSANSGIKQTGYVESRYGYFRYAFAF